MKLLACGNQFQNFTSTKRTTYKSKSDGVFTLPIYTREIGCDNLYDDDSDVKMLSSNSTSFFRSDIDWKEVGTVLAKQFPKNKVNIYDFACSDGSEAFSLIISLIEQLGEKKASRFFPIIATDIDSEIIQMAKSGKISASDYDIFQIENMIKNGKIEKYFQVTKLGYNKNLLTPKEILTKNVIFEQKNIQDSLDEIKKDDNNVILARNFWKYLSRNQLANASWKLGEIVNDKTLLFIGNFDLDKNKKTPFFIDALGFDINPNCNLNKNILSYNDFSPKHKALEDRSAWDDFIALNFSQYIPSYIYLKKNNFV